MKNQGVEEDRLQLLCDVSSAFRPGVLTTLVGMFVEEVMELVELDSLRDALVGLSGADGLSTEQRKRLTIAVELVANPSIIFMDEPTSGLDARAAAIVTRTVRNTVDTGRTVVCTIHQPSIDIFEAFDEAIPGVPKIAEGFNPAIWMLEISTSQDEANLNIDSADIYANSTLYHSTQQDVLNLVGAFYAAVFFLGSSNAINVQPVVAVERTVFYRERAAGMYSAMAYAFAQASQLSHLYQRDLNRYKRRELVGMVVSIEVSYILVQGFVYTILLFSMIGFTWRGDNFFWFFYFIVMSFTYFALYGIMAVALTPNHQVAGIDIPIWWRWYYWGNQLSWTIYGVIASQMGKKEGTVQIPGEHDRSLTEYLKDNLGYEYSFVQWAALTNLGFVIMFVFVFAYSIKFLNFQRR
ncbi:hypothetical protein ZIOFF_016089 [Zingiber officinale]|uniref:ABC-2 type transporter transmembrane domain-containing protein n=1 Tax=Zingiber officinale TaxID=94328 RepID=A0A8J5LMZ9_ZINOF|nr:hypothetical protein ZIOFF_016089 [Zingiber officinale]